MEKNIAPVVPLERIAYSILIIREQKVLLSNNLAILYGVEPKTLSQSVKRNQRRFPADFMFQLTKEEFGSLKSQIVTSNRGGIRRATPYAFTEQGVAMLSSILRSERAILVNIEIMRIFTCLRQILATNKELAEKLDKFEEKYDEQFQVIFEVLKKLMGPGEALPTGPMGFQPL